MRRFKRCYFYIKRQSLISHIIAIGNNLKDHNQSIKRYFVITTGNHNLSKHIIGYKKNIYKEHCLFFQKIYPHTPKKISSVYIIYIHGNFTHPYTHPQTYPAPVIHTLSKNYFLLFFKTKCTTSSV